MNIRKSIYKMDLHCTDGKNLPITIATTDIQRIEPLVEKHRMFYAARGYLIERFVIRDTRYLLKETDAQYEQEIMFCDIVDDTEKVSPIIFGSETAGVPQPQVTAETIMSLADEFEIDDNYKMVPKRK